MRRSIMVRAVSVAAAAALAAVALVTALSDEVSGGPAPTLLGAKMTVGETVTAESTPPSTVSIPVATPAHKATVPCGFRASC